VSARALRSQAGAHAAAIQSRTESLQSARFGQRLLAHDDSLWGDDRDRRKVAANRLGWLDVGRTIAPQAADLAAFAKEVAADGFTHAVLLGMGGSSLAPEVFRQTFGAAGGALDLAVLDNTSPAAVRAVTEAHDLSRTLFVVASKSGGTIEVTSFEKHFWERVSAVRGAQAGKAFIAITDPGTGLEQLARSRGYRRTFSNPPDIGGRYSALSCFGLVPAALIGVDVAALLAGAETERATLGQGPCDALALGAALGELARSGRDKLTIVASPALASVGVWVEQLVAESTGKEGRGIVPIAGEPLAAPSAYANDRVFVAMGSPSLPEPTERALEALAAAGHPVFRWNSARLLDLGADMMRWEIATAVAGAVLGVDPFDEPNVAEAKAATQAVLQRCLAEGHFPERTPAASAGDCSAYTIANAPPPGPTPEAWLAGLLAQGKPGDYFAVLAYLHTSDEREALLESIRLAGRETARFATTLGYGPRFLHSTGQLHKGGANNGVFLQLTCDEGDLPIPGERYGFGVLRRAQAAGDFDVLEKRGRRVMRIDLGSNIDAALERLAKAAKGAAAPR
jgi:glucose-6-phosphate isomerase/transaldolase/glucose-6-phosphate isomerase